MKKSILITWIVAIALVLSACTMSSNKKPKATPTTGIKPTSASTAIEAIAAATATSMKVNPTVKPVATNTPAPSEKPAGATSTAVKPAQATATSETALSAETTTTRLEFKSGGNIASVRGEMSGGQVNQYTLKINAGQIMNVAVWSPNGDVYLGIAGKNGSDLLSTGAKAVRYNGAVPASQDYLFTLTATGGTTSFSLDIVVTASGPTTTPQPTQNSQKTSTPTVGSVASGPFDPYTVYGSPQMSDPMNGGNINDWVNTDVDGKLPNTINLKMFVDNAKFYVIGKRPGWATWWFSPISLDNFFFETTYTTESCAGKDSYGMILRGPEHNAGTSYGYIVAFSCDGAYQITRLDSASPYSAVTLVGWTNSQYIASGSYQKNVLGIKMDGKILTLFANGYQLAEISDNVYTSGRYGLYIAPDASTDFTYRVVKMAYWLLEIKK